MKITSKMLPVILGAVLTGGFFATANHSLAATQHIVIDSGDNAMTKEDARQSQQQWNDTQALRHKMNQRAEKEFNKADKAFDTRDKCEQSENRNAYW